MNNIIVNIKNRCIQGINYLAKVICYLFNRIIECCNGQPRAKTTVTNTEPLIESKSLSQRDVIYLISENHYESEKYNAFKLLIFKMAAEKMVVYAIEGLERDPLAEKEFNQALQQKGMKADGYLYGIEDSFFNIFNTALDLNENLKILNAETKTIPVQLNEIIENEKNDLLCSLVIATNQKYLENFWNANALQSNLRQFLVKNKAELIKQTFEKQSKIFALLIAKSNTLDWINFTRGLARVLVSDLKTKLPIENHEILERVLKNLDKPAYQNIDEYHNFMKDLHLTLGNPFKVKNLNEIYSLTQHIGKPVVSILGEAHMPGVTQGLSDNGFTVLGKEKLLQRLKQIPERG